ncbi:ABC transporter substrate-binding protein [Peristeroidobacter soli]|uniref:ABC transporter substrate-binding protein n=1 Tax=Peristeroidobacter soli TaxID=2497877 RepID=UPI0013003653|nr:ABC transporter substrate-binding protein [Peristeroidobacter soli]
MAKPKPLRLGTPTPASVYSANLIAALELGYFLEEGIDLKLQQFPTTVPVMQAVAARTIDIGGGGVFPLVVANQPGKDHMLLRFFYNSLRKFSFEIVTRPDRPFNSIADLKGKKLGVLSLTAPYTPITRVVLKENGLKPTDIQLVAVGENRNAFALLERGEIDAYETFIGNSALFEGEGGKLKRLPYSDRINNLLTYSYYAHEETLKQDPAVLARFGRAVAKGVLTCNIAPEWCVKTVWKHYPHLKPAPEAWDTEMTRQVRLLRTNMAAYMAFPSDQPRRFGEYPQDAFQNLIDILKEGGELPAADIDPNLFYTNSLVAQINDFDPARIEAKARDLN